MVFLFISFITRKLNGDNRDEVFGLIKIHSVSLKEYEDEIRLIPIDKLCSILQIYDAGLMN